MIRKITLMLCFFIIAYTAFESNYAHTFHGSPPPFNASAPEMSSCSGGTCHSGPVDDGNGSTTISLGQDSLLYQINKTYDMSITIEKEGSARYGFQMVAFNEAGESVGNFVIMDGEFVGLNTSEGIQFIQHEDIPNDNSNTFNFQWESPNEDVGAITFYASGNAADGTGSSANDFIYTSALSINFDINNVGLENIGSLEKISLYPNPTQGMVNIQSEMSNKLESIQLFDLNGRLLENFLPNSQNLDLSNYSTGLYLILFTNATGTSSQKIWVK